ncbi:MAG TPA: pyridoxal-dependent decarboxylase [Puia sp.]|jgi:glutamate/tyrosine decarboxylase-like PLP-dependent enzyme
MEYTLDPPDWEALRLLGHRMVDDMMEYLRTAGERKAWEEMPGDRKQELQQPLPKGPQKATAVYEDFLHNVLPYNINNVHPRFWGWVQGGGTPFGMLADMLASGMNANNASGEHAAMYVEKQVLDWSKELFGFPSSASGILTSGASLSNITALVVARDHFHAAIRQKGLRAVDGQLTIYGSSETHTCAIKAAGITGIGTDNFRKVPVDANYQVRTDELRNMIAEDRRNGFQPFCIVGNAGTVNTGAIDDLEELAAIAKAEGCWYHIDGAFGAIPYILPEYREQLKGLPLADSLSFDFHKWFYMNYEVGCVLIKDAAAHRTAFSTPVNYLIAHQRGASAGPEPFTNYGLEWSRGFKALKVWMLLKEHGINEYAQLVRQNLHQAQYLAGLINDHNELELLANVPMNIVCYRWNPGRMSNEALNACNKEIVMRVHEEGIAIPSYTILQDRYAIRVAITNHRSRLEDFADLAASTVRIGHNIRQASAHPA